MPAVTMTAVFCGVVLLVAGSGGARPAIRKTLRIALIAGAIVLAGLAFVGLQGNRAVSSAEDASSRARPTKAVKDARTAIRWAPWSSQAGQLLGRLSCRPASPWTRAVASCRALSKDREDWSIWLDLAVVSRDAEQRQAFAQASRLNPLSSDVAAYRRQSRRADKGRLR
jgi:hypothetical protein